MKKHLSEERSLDGITPYARNPRNNKEAISGVAASIREFGFTQPILVDEEGVIISGHTRHAAALQLGMETVPVVVASGLSPEQIKALRILDNKLGEKADWDQELLSLELDELSEFDFEPFDVEFSEPDEAERPRDLSETHSETYEVAVECESESQQGELYEELSERGFKCRVLTL